MEANPYEGMTRAGKQWYAGFKEASACMADAMARGDWSAALGWAQIAGWQHEMLYPGGMS